MKKRTITISLIVLAFVLLFGIGYAGWVIASSTSGEAGGNFKAYAVSEASLVVTPVDQDVTFGKPETPGTYVWLDASSDMDEDDLSASFKIKWTGAVGEDGISFRLTHTFYNNGVAVTGDNLTALNKLINNPTYSVPDGSSLGYSFNNTTNVITLNSNYEANTEIVITVNYTWGPVFGNINPFNYFNPLAKDGSPAVAYNSESTNQAVALNALTALKTFVDGPGTFKVAVTKN